MSVCSKLCGMPEQNSGGVPVREPERLIKWFVGVVVIAVGVNLLSSFVVAQKWAWASAGGLWCGDRARCAEYWSAAPGSVMAQRRLGPWLCSR